MTDSEFELSDPKAPPEESDVVRGNEVQHYERTILFLDLHMTLQVTHPYSLLLMNLQNSEFEYTNKFW